MSEKIVLISTGGTIASRTPSSGGGAVNVDAGASLLQQAFAGPNACPCAIEIIDLLHKPSFQFTSPDILDLALAIRSSVSRPDVNGVVITHGTDTMEESCFLADILLDTSKPVVFTGAQLAADNPQPDGPRNLRNAIYAAVSAKLRKSGAVICFDGEIHAARYVTKTHASALGAFTSPSAGPIAHVDNESVRCVWSRPPHEALSLPERLPHVALLRLVVGIERETLDAIRVARPVAIVVEAFGRGNGPIGLADWIDECTGSGIPVILTTRCLAGRVHPVYGGGSGGADLAQAGAIFAGDLSGPKARLLAMCVIGAGKGLDHLRREIDALVH